MWQNALISKVGDSNVSCGFGQLKHSQSRINSIRPPGCYLMHGTNYCTEKIILFSDRLNNSLRTAIKKVGVFAVKSFLE